MSDSSNAVLFAQRLWCTTGAVVAGLAVIAGAFGAHGLRGEYLTRVHAKAEPKVLAGFEVPASYKFLQDFRTAADYQMAHGIAIVLVGMLGRRGKARVFAHAAASCFLAGVLLFCGSLYTIALTGLTEIGTVTPPIGGVLFIAGWVLLAVAAALPRSESRRQ